MVTISEMSVSSYNLLSKSNLMLGFTCEKALHLAVHRPKLKAKPSPQQQQIFDQGNEVGAKAREYFDQQGALIQAKPWEYSQSLEATRLAVESRQQTIFEAAVSDGRIYSRIDILHRKADGWHLIEVKASNGVKEEHIHDVAIQALACRRSGLEIASYSVMHLNRAAAFPNLSDLFLIQDMTAEVREVLPEVEKRIDRLVGLAAGSEPAKNLGRHCQSPYECPFKGHCWKDVPDYSVFELPRMDADAAGGLFASGLRQIVDLTPEMFPDQPAIQRAIRATRTGTRYLDRAGLTAALAEWKFPFHFLDFETVMPAIPRYDGCTPYTQVPYQFSCHILRGPGVEPEHREYLYLGTGDPRMELVKELCAAIGPEGSVMAYYSRFEAERMNELAEVFPAFAGVLKSIVDRLVDPLPLMREFVYDPEFRGSFSIKAVAPALLGSEFSYAGMEVGDGLMAGVWADRCLRGLESPEGVARIRPKLLEYCRKDTMALLSLWQWMGSA